MKRQMKRVGLAVALCLPGGFLLSSAWSAPAACDVFSYTPTMFTSYEVGGTGGRAGCASTVSVQTYLKYDRWGPDVVTAHRGGRVTNITWTPHGCSGGQAYFTQTSSETGQYSRSANRTLSC